MVDIYVFSPDDQSNDYSTMGLACSLKATECVFKETANGDSILNLSHPLDEWGQYTYLVRGNILLAPVPVRTTPEIQNDGSVVATVWTYKVKDQDLLTSKTQRTLYKKQTGSGAIHILDPEETVTVVSRPAGTNTRWKVKSKYGTGWMMPSGLSDNPIATHNLPENNANDIEYVQSPWTITPQLFRIFDVNKGLDEVQVTARHISYDLLYNMTQYKSDDAVELQNALNGVLTNCYNPDHGFTAYTNIKSEQPGLDYADKNPIDAFLDPEAGICAKFEVGLVRDNFDLYFLHDPGINRGVTIEYGKNLTGIKFEDSDDEVVTRIVPVGENKDGTPLYLVDGVGTFTGELRNGDSGDDVRMMQSLLVKAGYNIGSTGVDGVFGNMTENGLRAFQRDTAGLSETGVFRQADYEALTARVGIAGNGAYIDSPHINDYPVPHIYKLECENCTVNDKEEGAGRITVDIARARMREQALEMFEQDCDLPSVKMEVEFQNLGDTEEYAQFRNLENCFLFDYVLVRHVKQNIDVTARIVGIEWDVLRERMNRAEIGQVGKTLANSGVTTWQIPSGFSGSKISFGTIGAGQMGDNAITTRHVQSDTIATRHLQAQAVQADQIDANAIRAYHISSESIDTQHIRAGAVDADQIKANAITSEKIQSDSIESRHIRSGQIESEHIRSGSIMTDKLNAENLTATIATFIDAAAVSGRFDFAKVQHLVSSAMNVEKGVGEEIYIRNLAVSSASMVSATIGDLVILSNNGKYYRIDVTDDGTVHTTEVTVSAGEIAAGQTRDGKQIVATNLNVTRIDGENIFGSFADITEIFTTLLTAGSIRASDALIASATVPQLYAAAIKALSDDLVLTANNSIRMLVGDLARQYNAGTRNYIPQSRYLKDAILVATRYRSVVGQAYVDVSPVAEEETWGQTTVYASAFSVVDTDGGFLKALPGNEASAYREISDQASVGWRIMRYDFPERKFCKLARINLNSEVGGVLPAAYLLGGELYSLDINRIGLMFDADALLTNMQISGDKKAITSITVSILNES